MYSMCQECTLGKEREGVCGNRGPQDAAIVIVGEAPGYEEVASGVPFVGKAGRLLEQLLAECGISSTSCLVTNVCHCRPLANRTPSTAEMKVCREQFLKNDLSSYPRKVIIALGNYGYYGTVPKGTATGITKRHGIWEWNDEFACWVVPCIHPAGALRNPRYISQIKSTMQTVAKFLRGEYDPHPKGIEVCIPENRQQVDEMLEDLREKEVAFDIETTGYDFLEDEIVCISLCSAPELAYVVPTPYYFWEGDELVGADWNEKASRTPYWSPDDWIYVEECLRELFLKTKNIVAHNAVFDLSFLKHKWRIVHQGVLMDTMLIHHLLDENARHGLKPLACQYLSLGEYDREFDLVFNKIKRSHGLSPEEKHYGRVDPLVLFKYAGLDACACLQLKQVMLPSLQEQGLTNLFFRLTMPLLSVLLKMEMLGIRVDKELLLQYEKEWGEELDSLEGEIATNVGFDLNVRSSVQLQQYFFSDKGYKPLKSTTTDRPSVDEESLKYLEEEYKDQVATKILQYKRIHKLFTTYVRGILDDIGSDGRVHTRYLIHGTNTGRLSSTKPNMQNIPRASHDESLAGKIKNIFIAEEGFLLARADFRQLEIRVWAHASNDPDLVRLMGEDDIHAAIASEIFQKPRDQITKEERVIAKACVFGTLYGRGAKSIADEFNWTMKKSQAFIDDFFARFPTAKQWLDKQVSNARTRGHVTNLFGRRRRLPDIHSSETGVVAQAERQAVNAPIQGGAADICNSALIRLSSLLEQSGFKSRPLLQVHDEIVFEVAEEEKEVVLPLIQQIMEAIPKGFRVALPVEIEIGSSWGSMEEWHDNE